MNPMEEEGEAKSVTGESSSQEKEEKKEHMFDKVVTPSDVGKLNRLVIPKQHAERYFPLDSTIDNKGLLLNFEDRTGNSWRFRYSYWNSSQSYVMTKGWSRFVKDKKLDAGDIVSFHRNGVNKLFIDWKKRPKIHHHQSNLASHLFPRLYSYHNPLEQFSRNHESFDLWGQNRHFHEFSRDLGYGYLVRDNPTAVINPLVIESVPVMMMHRRGGGEVAMAAREGGGESGSGKRLRLFGVDMECNVNTPEPEPEMEEAEEEEYSGGGGGLLELRLVSNDESLASLEDDEQHHYTKKGKSSLSFDLD